MASCLTDFLTNVTTTDTRKRQECYEGLSNYLKDPRSSLDCDDLDGFIEGLSQWVGCSNYKVWLKYCGHTGYPKTTNAAENNQLMGMKSISTNKHTCDASEKQNREIYFSKKRRMIKQRRTFLISNREI